MTVDTAVKIVEGEKCGLDVSSYGSVHSLATSKDVGGNVGGVSNVDGRDDYVFVNGSDGALSDDHCESNENGEVIVAESSVEGSDGVREVRRKVDGGEKKVENGVNVGEEVEGVGLVKENGGIKVESEVVEVGNGMSESNVEGEASDGDKVLKGGDSKVGNGGNVGDQSKNGHFVKENGEINVESVKSERNVEGGADFGDNISEHVVGSDSMPVVDEVKDEETAVQNCDNGNASVDDIATHAADVDDSEGGVEVGDSVSLEVEGQASTAGGSVCEASEAQKVVENNDPAIVEVPLSSNGERKGLPLKDAMPREQIVNCHQQDLQPVNGEAEDMNLNKAEAEIREQDDLDSVTDGERQDLKSLESEAVGSELDWGDITSRTADVDNSKEDVAVGFSVPPEVEGQKNTAVGCVSDSQETQAVVTHDNPACVEVPLASDGESKGLPLNALPEEQSVNCQHQDLQRADGEAEDISLNEAEPEIREQGDLNTVTDSESQDPKSVESVAVGSELDLGEMGECLDYIATASIAEPAENLVLQTISSQSAEAQIPDNSDTASPVVEGLARVAVGQSDDNKLDSESGAEESVGASLDDVQSVITDESAVQEDPAMSNGSRSSELTAEARGSWDASVAEDVSHTQTAEPNESVDVIDKEIVGSQEPLSGESVDQDQAEEQTGSVDVIDKEIVGSQESSAGEDVSQDQAAGKSGSEIVRSEEPLVGEDVSQDQVARQSGSADVINKELSLENSEEPIMAEDTTSSSKLQSVDGLGIGDHCNGHSDSHAGVSVTEYKDFTASDESSGDAGSCLKSDDVPSDTLAELPAVSDSVTSKEQLEVDDSSVSLNISADDASSMMKSEISESPLLSSVSDAKSETNSVNDDACVVIKSNNNSSVAPEPQISFGSFTCSAPLQSDVKLQSDKMKSHRFSGSSNSMVNCGNGVTIRNPLANGVHSGSLNHSSVSGQVAQSAKINEVSEPTMEGSEVKSVGDQNVNPDLVRSPFYWLIKIPYFEDKELKEQKKHSEAQQTEKTQIRDDIMTEYQNRKASLREPKAILDAARSDEKAARDLMMAKKKEIESAHSLINLARHVVDIDSQIRNLDHRYNHETVDLKEERYLIRELTRLKKQREQLYANSQMQLEVQQALAKKDETEDHLKVLKKELDALRENHSKASERVIAAKDKFDKEVAVLDNLTDQLTSAKRAQQEAYTHDWSLKKKSYEKNKYLYKYRDDLKKAKDFADAGKIDLLERHCINHVEEMMELWNKNDEFRKEYVRCNMNSILWKFGTKDSRARGLDEKQPSLENIQKVRVNSSAKVKSVTAVSNVDRDFPVLEATKPEGKLLENVVEPVNKAAPAKLHEAKSKNSLAEVSGRKEVQEDQQESKLTKEEEELARKAEQLRKDEEAARLREQRKLEEKIKAQEALERKKRIAEKKQAKAEFKARKEAEEKEKERQRRAKKKEKMRGINPDSTENELPQSTEPASEGVTEREGTKENPATVAKRPAKASLHTKPIKTTAPLPPALRNRGKRGILRYWPYAVLVLVAIVLLFLGNLDTKSLMQKISGLLH